jgi:hypothetical protein
MMYESRTYSAMPGRLPNLHKRFADVTTGYFSGPRGPPRPARPRPSTVEAVALLCGREIPLFFRLLDLRGLVEGR